MSVLIRDMDEIPEDGAVLVVKHDYDGKAYIKYAGMMGYHMELVALPEKHGRLVDIEALSRKMYHDAFETDTDMQKWDSGCWIRYKMFENNRNDALTVIEEE